MKRNKDIFDRFRQEAEHFSANPSTQAWQKLERRLDGHRRRHRLNLYRSLGMAAAVLVLVTVLILLAVTLDSREDKLHFAQHQENLPKHLQDIYVAEGDARAIRVVEINRSYEKLPLKHIEEGDPNNKIMPTLRSRPL